MQVSDYDLLMPPRAQRQLADLLHAQVVSFPTGHMGLNLWRDRYHSILLEHLQVADVIRVVNGSQPNTTQSWDMMLLQEPIDGLQMDVSSSSCQVVAADMSDGSQVSDDTAESERTSSEAAVVLEVITADRLVQQDSQVDSATWYGPTCICSPAQC